MGATYYLTLLTGLGLSGCGLLISADSVSSFGSGALTTQLTITSPNEGASFTSSNASTTFTGECQSGATLTVTYSGQPHRFVASSSTVNQTQVSCPSSGLYSFVVDFAGGILVNGTRALSLFQTWNGTAGSTLTRSLSYTTATNLDQSAYLKAASPSLNAAFGTSVAIDGETAVVGSPNYNGAQGEVFVFVKQNGVWTQQQRLVAPVPYASDNYGRNVSISGDTLVIGADQHDYDENESNLLSNAGAAYVYTRSGSTWTLQQKLAGTGTNGRVLGDAFGYDVSISGDTIAIGAYAQDYTESGAVGPTDAGAVYVFTRSSGTWSFQQKLVGFGSNGSMTTDNFGWSLALSGDSLAVGTPLQDYDSAGGNLASSAGTVFTFTRSGGVWTPEQRLVATGLNARNANDTFGRSVALEGDTLAVGAPMHGYDAAGGGFLGGTGAVWVYTRSAGVWTIQQKLAASTRGNNDTFGWQVGLSGDVIAVGAPQEDSNATTVNGNVADNSAPAAGAAYIFQRSSSVWTQNYYLKPNNTDSNDVFGSSVAVSGDSVIAGASAESSNSAASPSNNAMSNAGAAYIFR